MSTETLGAQPPAASDERNAPSRVAPKEPGEALRTFRTSGGLRMELLASEPLVMSPVAIRYDEDGSLYVAEMSDYPTPEGEPTGRIRLLRDSDDDGKFDTSSIFVDGLKSPSSIACWKGGIFVTTHGELWYFKRTNLLADKADQRIKIFTGFGLGSLEYMQNNLQWGIDNKIYGATGPNGGLVKCVGDSSASPVSLAGLDFCFDPVDSKIDPVSGGGQWGNSFDDAYNRFICRNIAPARHVILPQHYVKRNPYLKVPRLSQPLTSEEGDVPVFRVSPPEAWRVVRARQRQELGKNANPGEINEVGYFTAACGITVYRGDAYPSSYRGNIFIPEPAGNLIHRRSLEPLGVTFKANRIEEKSEVVASSDNFFRPVHLVNAPDGTLHIVDMYREVVEDPKYVPEELVRSGQVDVRGGKNHGRIYRLAPPGFKVPRPPRLGKASTAELVAHLQNSNSWWRETAQRLIYERQDQSAIKPLRKLLTETSFPFARLHALWTLDGLNALTAKEIAKALKDTSPVVREHALRLAEQRFENNAQLLATAVALKSDPEPRVRFQLALTLGEVTNAAPSTEAEVVAALAEIADQDIASVWVRTAILSSAFERSDSLLEPLLTQPAFQQEAEGRGLLKDLAYTVGRRNRSDEIRNVLSAVSSLGASQSESGCKLSVTASLADGMRQAGGLLASVVDDQTSPAGRVFRGAIQMARSASKDGDAAVGLRQDALTLLSCDRFEDSKSTLTNLLRPNQPEEVQLATVRALASYHRPESAALLLEYWVSAPPSVRTLILDVLISRAEWIELLFASLENKTISTSAMDKARRNVLLKHAQPTIQKRAALLFESTRPQSREAVVQRYQSGGLDKGDSVRGKLVFERACITCHRFAGTGNDIGPNLSAYGQEPASLEKLLISIIDPNREVSPNYTAYSIELNNGESLSGIIDTQTPTSITLKQAGNSDGLIILRTEIKRMRSSDLSLMPEGFEENITPSEMADLLAFLTTIRGGI